MIYRKRGNVTVTISDDQDIEKFIDISMRIGELLDKNIVKYGANWREDLKDYVGIGAYLNKLAKGERFDHTDSDIYILNYLKENLGDGIP